MGRVTILLLLLPLLAVNGFVVTTQPHWNKLPTAVVGTSQWPAPALVRPPTFRGALEEPIPSSGSDATSPSFSVSIPFVVTWIALIAWAFSPIAPGSLGSPQDTMMLNQIMADPVHPNLNELCYTLFNFFAVIPILLACLVLPQGSVRGLPAAPVLLVSCLVGFFALGPYMAFRAPPVTSIHDKKTSWFTTQILENKVVNGLVLLLTLYLPIGSNLLGAYADNPSALWQGFVDLVSQSRFCAVSLVDLGILYVTAVALTPRAVQIRSKDITASQAMLVALATALVPVVGTAVYLLLRPPLPSKE